LNPRPQALFGQIYMFSGLFWISPRRSRSRTLPAKPVPLNLAFTQGTRVKASRCGFTLQPGARACAFTPCPAHRQTVARLTGL